MLACIVLILLAALTAGYAGILAILRRGLGALQQGSSPLNPFISIIVPMRNEGLHISACLRSLLAQDYPTDKFEIIVVDDGSSDGSGALVTSFLERGVKLLNSTWNSATASPKQAAIAAGISAARGELIVTTDADCVFARHWLSSLASEFREETLMVAGWVCIDPERENGLFSKVQSLELLGIVAVGAACIRLHRPLIANGANLAYRRSAYDAVGGFDGLGHWVSGDDVLLMQKVAERSRTAIRFCPAREGVVHTLPQRSVREFVAQRLRWSSKIGAFSSPDIRSLLLIAYLYYSLFIAAFLLSLTSAQLFLAFLITLCLKTLADGIFLHRVCGLVGRRNLLRFLPVAELFHILYILLVTPCGLTGRFSWKGRRYGKNRPVT